MEDNTPSTKVIETENPGAIPEMQNVLNKCLSERKTLTETVQALIDFAQRQNSYWHDKCGKPLMIFPKVEISKEDCDTVDFIVGLATSNIWRSGTNMDKGFSIGTASATEMEWNQEQMVQFAIDCMKGA